MFPSKLCSSTRKVFMIEWFWIMQLVLPHSRVDFISAIKYRYNTVQFSIALTTTLQWLSLSYFELEKDTTNVFQIWNTWARIFLSEHSVNKISQWRHININGSQITDELIVRSTAWSGYQYKNINSPVLLPFVRGIHRWLVDGYPLVFSYHDVIMYTRLSFLQVHLVCIKRAEW